MAYPVELSAASLPIHGALRLQDLAQRLPSMPLPEELEDASLIGTAVRPPSAAWSPAQRHSS